MERNSFLQKLSWIMLMPNYTYICIFHSNIYEFLLAVILSTCIMEISKGLTKVLRHLSETEYEGITIHETEKKKIVWRYGAPMFVPGRNEKVEIFFIVMTFIIYLELLYDCYFVSKDFQFFTTLLIGFIVGAFVGNIGLILNKNTKDDNKNIEE